MTTLVHLLQWIDHGGGAGWLMLAVTPLGPVVMFVTFWQNRIRKEQ